MKVEHIDQAAWNSLIGSFPAEHFLQTSQWAEVKAEVGWKAHRLAWKDDAGEVKALAQVLCRSARPIRRFGPALSVGYVPRGPLLDWNDAVTRQQVLIDLESFAREQNLVFLKIDPEVIIGRGIPAEGTNSDDEMGTRVMEDLAAKRWHYSAEQIQFKNTVILDLNGDEEHWLARMKQKTRYNIRLAQKNGVQVKKATLEDLPLIYRMYAETANRDGFIIRPEDYYLGVWSKFLQANMAEALLAEVDGIPVAGLVLFHLGRTAWYVYGMSTQLHREKMPNYLLQWEAMRVASEKGCLHYDLWGAPDVFDKNNSMFGVYRFKEGLGGEVVRTVGAWDLPLRPAMFTLYQTVIPRLLSITRMLRRKQIKQEVL